MERGVLLELLELAAEDGEVELRREAVGGGRGLVAARRRRGGGCCCRGRRGGGRRRELLPLPPPKNDLYAAAAAAATQAAIPRSVSQEKPPEEEEDAELVVAAAEAAAAAAAATAAAAASSAAVLPPEPPPPPPPPFAPALGMSSRSRYRHSALGPARIDPSSSSGASPVSSTGVPRRSSAMARCTPRICNVAASGPDATAIPSASEVWTEAEWVPEGEIRVISSRFTGPGGPECRSSSSIW